jgi:hypothetical protein
MLSLGSTGHVSDQSAIDRTLCMDAYKQTKLQVVLHNGQGKGGNVPDEA